MTVTIIRIRVHICGCVMFLFPAFIKRDKKKIVTPERKRQSMAEYMHKNI